MKGSDGRSDGGGFGKAQNTKSVETPSRAGGERINDRIALYSSVLQCERFDDGCGNEAAEIFGVNGARDAERAEYQST